MGKWSWDSNSVGPYGNGKEMVLDQVRVGCTWCLAIGGSVVDGVQTHGDCVQIVYGCM